MFNGQFIPALELMNVPGKMIRMKNFSGNERRARSGKITNTFGQRNFVVKFDEEQGKALEAQGWDIFWFPHESEEQPLEAGLTVPVNLSNKNQRGEDRHPDEVIVVTETERVRQNEKTIGNLDGAKSARMMDRSRLRLFCTRCTSRSRPTVLILFTTIVPWSSLTTCLRSCDI
jgi:hypothetical protein